MPFEIVRNDIVNMQVDAIVNTANPRPVVGAGVDSAIHKKAGERLLAARREIGPIDCGDAAVTPGFGLNAKYVIHTVGPVWTDGEHGEEWLLSSCYAKSLKLAKEHGCESIAFPLISAGSYGFPKPLALQIAVSEISAFLMENDMQIYLVVFGNEAFALSEKLFKSVSSFIDENYVSQSELTEYGVSGNGFGRALRRMRDNARNIRCTGAASAMPKRADTPDTAALEYDAAFECTPAGAEPEDLTHMLENLDAGFSETLLRLIDRSGKKDSEIYKKANVDRKLFSKIRNNAAYKPSKTTALAFAFALELNIDQTRDFIARAGFALSRSNKFDVIIEYFLVNGNYDVFELNEVLFAFDQPLIGA